MKAGRCCPWTDRHLHAYGPLTSNVAATTIQRGRGGLFHTGAGQLDSHSQKNEAGCLPPTVYKINFKWIRNFGASAKTLKQ